jgi:hypothetical protein
MISALRVDRVVVAFDIAAQLGVHQGRAGGELCQFPRKLFRQVRDDGFALFRSTTLPESITIKPGATWPALTMRSPVSKTSTRRSGEGDRCPPASWWETFGPPSAEAQIETCHPSTKSRCLLTRHSDLNVAHSLRFALHATMNAEPAIRCSTIAPIRSFCSEDMLDARTDFRFWHCWRAGSLPAWSRDTQIPADQGHRLEGPGGFRRKCLKLRWWRLQLARTKRACYSAMA